jgi:hypothetical protein
MTREERCVEKLSPEVVEQLERHESIGPEGRRRAEVLRRASSAAVRDAWRKDAFSAENIEAAAREALGEGVEADWSGLGLPAVLHRVALAWDEAMTANRVLHRAGKQDYQVWLKQEPSAAAEWFTWGFGVRMPFLMALRVSGELAGHFKAYPEVRVLLLEDEDGREVLERCKGKVIYAPREVVVWRCGVIAEAWRPVPGRRCEAVQRRGNAPRAVVLGR